MAVTVNRHELVAFALVVCAIAVLPQNVTNFISEILLSLLYNYEITHE